MAIYAVTGIAEGLNATESAVQATDQALSQVGRAQIVLAFVAASDDYPVRQVVNGVSGLLSDTPLFGFSTPSQLANDGIHHRSIIVSLLISDDVQARADFWTGYSEDSGRCMQNMLETLHLDEAEPKALLLVADGFNARFHPNNRKITGWEILSGRLPLCRGNGKQPGFSDWGDSLRI